MKKQLYDLISFGFYQTFRHCTEEIPQAFTYISFVYNAPKRRYTVLRQGDMVDGKDRVIKRRRTTSCIFAKWILEFCGCRIEHDDLQLAI